MENYVIAESNYNSLGKVLDVNDFTWDASFNITYNKNKIIALPDNGQVRNRQNGQQVYTGRKVVNPGTGKLEDEKVYVGGFRREWSMGYLSVTRPRVFTEVLMIFREIWL